MLFSLVAVLGPPSVSAKSPTNYNVLILKNSDAWGSPSVENTLTNMSIPYDVMTSTELQNKTAQDLIGAYDMIIIVSDQGQQFYNEIGPQMGKLEEYVKAGKVLEIHAANWGWGGGLWTTPLPGGVEIKKSYSNHDYVLANNTTLTSSYASHGYFVGLPANAEIITVQAPTGTPDNTRPSTATYTFGNGKVFVTGLTIEFSVARKGPEWEAFYRGIIMDNLGYSSIVLPPKAPLQRGIDVMLFNFYYYIQYHRALDEYNVLYTEAVEGGMDNETLGIAQIQNSTAAEYYANASQYGPVVSNFPRIYIFIDLRKAALHQKQAVGILEEAMADW
ncbi:pyrolysin [Thermococcus sp. 4557]|uniref:pyrolysin n=1 Tax=Thermococcus sp. (strain CGMCC 1.5172 / 4557) TaxID=1042877 RepID=UPI001EE57ABC|nr:pyrolysin [Thermococcus sp. 4557]